MTIDPGTKEKLRQKCIVIKEEMAGHLKSAMDETQQNANEYGAPKDRYDSFRTQLLRKRDMLAQQLAVVSDELRYLRQLRSNHVSKVVEPGALVSLPGQIVYVSVGLGKIDIDGKTYFAVSPIVPLAAAMRGLGKGDKFFFRGAEMEILDIQ